MATFNGTDIFGPCPIFTGEEPANAEQLNHYPGVVGVERLDLAPQASTTVVTGVFAGASPAEVGAAFNALAALKRAGAVGVLVDSEDTTWTDAILHNYRKVGRMVWAPGWGWTRQYEMTFLHLGTG